MNEKNTRVRKSIINLDYEETRQFFAHRADRYNSENPYSVTMYQDDHPELVRERNRTEIEKLRPKLHLSGNSRVLDVACGIGRWADAIDVEVEEYCGVDFSGELVRIANQRNKKVNFSFYEGSINEVDEILRKNKKGRYNTVLMVGILMYLNDGDLLRSLQAVEKICEKEAVICIREPVGIFERLTLKDFFRMSYRIIIMRYIGHGRNYILFWTKHFCRRDLRLPKKGFCLTRTY